MTQDQKTVGDDPSFEAPPCTCEDIAKAWIDRWRALGGSFGLIYQDGKPPQLTRGMLVALEYWKPTDREHPTLPPHTWLIEPGERGQHSGAVKVLEGLLELVPGLMSRIYDLVAPTIPELAGEA